MKIVESNVIYSLSFLFAFLYHLNLKALPAARFTSSARLNGRSKRMMGKWVVSFFFLFFFFRWIDSFRCLHFSVCFWFFSSSRKNVCNGGVSVGNTVVVLHLKRWHAEAGHASVSPWRQAEWQTHRGVSCCLAFCPSPLSLSLFPPSPALTPHWDTHMLLAVLRVLWSSGLICVLRPSVSSLTDLTQRYITCTPLKI